MSARSERLFLPVLREVERGLPLPIPSRVRILRELEHDLEGLTDRLAAMGMAPDEARRRAVEALVPDGGSLAALASLHAPRYAKLTRRLAPDRLRRAERTTLAVATALVTAAGARALLGIDLLDDPSPVLTPVLTMGGILCAAVAAKAFQLLIKRDHRDPARGLSAILGLSVATLAAGILCAFTDFYQLAALLETSPGLADTLATQWLLRDATLLAAALLLALTGGLAWFALDRWVAVLQGERDELLGTTPIHRFRRRR